VGDLNEQRRRFVEAYTGPSMGNATDAARRAGYAHPDRQGHRLLKNAEIQAAVRAASVEVRSAAILTREERMTLLSRALKGEAVIPDGEGPNGALCFRPLSKDEAWMKAHEILAKMSGDFTEKREHEHRGATVQVYLPSNGRDG
jgi:phage terminase small subunit